jgi:predicted transcriptional regulator/transcriptional regulator with XRE-family HTH domain
MASSYRQIGLRLQRLRLRHQLTQAELARRLQLSPSYLNQIERNQRPLTLEVQQRLRDALGDIDGLLDANDPATLIGPLDATLRSLGHASVTTNELRVLAGNLPQVANALLELHRQHQHLRERTAALELQIGNAHAASPLLSPGDQVRDYFNRAHNHIAELDEHAEALSAELGLTAGNIAARLRQRLADRHGILVRDSDAHATSDKGSYDVSNRTLWLPSHLKPGQQSFQMAAQLAALENPQLLQARIADAGFADAERSALARISLCNYYAGALVMPYGKFLHSARASHYDIEWLAHQFGVGFEAVCHRLSTLQRPGATGLPLFFVRVDRAGNVSKRHSATDFHFSHVGGSCPLWIVYEAFSQPGRILTQITRMPDGRNHFWLSRQVSRSTPGYGQPSKTFAVALGCDLRNADQLIYSRGWDLKTRHDAVPIGPGCLTCERNDCMQRAFPALQLRRTADA